MIALVISEKGSVIEQLNSVLNEMNFNTIHYHTPVKALDNIEEISPEAVIINAVDFPRHWKIIAQYIRCNSSKEYIIILLTNNSFKFSESDKVLEKEIQGLVNLDDELYPAATALKEILADYQVKHCTSKTFIQIPKKSVSAAQFLFTHPVSGAIVTGTVNSLTKDYIYFIPDDPYSTDGLAENSFIEHGSLKLASQIIGVTCKTVLEPTGLKLNFVDLNDNEQKLLENFISTEECNISMHYGGVAN